MPLFEVRNVSRSFPLPGGEGGGLLHVLHDVSFEVGEREVFAIVGPSGSGKTTLLRLLDALEEPGEGEVRFDGGSLRDRDIVDLRRQVAMLFQAPTLFAGDVRANLLAPLRLRDGGRATADEDGFRRLLGDVGLDGSYLGRNADSLSAGEQQRVAFARAMVLGPRAVLLDEPTANLDPTTAQGFLRTLSGYVREQGLTAVMVTHRLEEARGIADRVLLLVEGRAVCVQPTEEFLAAPANETAGRFIRGEREAEP